MDWWWKTYTNFISKQKLSNHVKRPSSFGIIQDWHLAGMLTLQKNRVPRPAPQKWTKPAGRTRAKLKFSLCPQTSSQRRNTIRHYKSPNKNLRTFVKFLDHFCSALPRTPLRICTLAPARPAPQKWEECSNFKSIQSKNNIWTILGPNILSLGNIL